MVNYVLLILSGLAIGIIVAAPIGPVNLICIRRTLAFGPLNGFLSGLGAAIGDSVFGIVTAFGLTAIAQLIKGFYVPLQIVGGLMLIIFGIHTIFSKPKKRELDKAGAADKGASTLVGAIVSTFALTITNPATLFGFAALFAGLGSLIGEKPRFVEAAILVGGVAGGSVAWWFTITTIVGLFHKNIDDRAMVWINRVMGIAITLFGVAVLGNLLRAQLA
ncbi:MAG TPA: LysE family transporter [Rhizomicrobium sp.]|jgi:threonine/homoserine/homoserine lactone efflux protein